MKIAKSLFLLLTIFFISCNKYYDYDNIFLIDTILSLKFYSGNFIEAEKIKKDVIDEIERLDKIFDVYSNESEISKVNKEAQNGFVNISPDLCFVIQTALKYCELSEGKFDITILPLVLLWDIKNVNPKVPSEKDIKYAMSFVNYKDIEIKDCKIRFKKKGMGIDLGAIAKGYIADKCVSIMKNEGVKSGFINLGGNIVLIGNKNETEKWNVFIKNPRSGEIPDLEVGDDVIKYFSLSDCTVVTSGDYERFFIKDNIRYHHIFDPFTGKPSTPCVSTTIITNQSIDADALSTTVFVLGPQKGFELVKKLPQTYAYIVYFENGKYKIVEGGNFPQ